MLRQLTSFYHMIYAIRYVRDPVQIGLVLDDLHQSKLRLCGKCRLYRFSNSMSEQQTARNGSWVQPIQQGADYFLPKLEICSAQP